MSIKNTLCFDLYKLNEYETNKTRLEKVKYLIKKDYGFRLLWRLSKWQEAVKKMSDDINYKQGVIYWLQINGWVMEENGYFDNKKLHRRWFMDDAVKTEINNTVTDIFEDVRQNIVEELAIAKNAIKIIRDYSERKRG
jgi:hypothetical protein